MATEATGALPARPASALASRLGRRVLLLFVLSALLPLLLVGALVVRDAGERQQAQARQEARLAAESYGMLLIGRLTTASGALQALAAAPRATAADLVQAAGSLPWAASVRRVEGPPGASRIALQPGERWPLVQLSQPLGASAALVVAVDHAWLFEGLEGYAADSQLQVLDAQGLVLAGAGAAPAGGQAPIEGRWQMFLRESLGAAPWEVRVLRARPRVAELFSGEGNLVPGALAATVALVALLSAVAIRRQLRPLQQLRAAAERYARRDFGAPLDTAAPDEFGDLARAFDGMSSSLRVQFSALEALAEVDRLLLHAPDLERILDVLLPRMAGLLGCDALSVLLLDPDLPRHGRCYDWVRGQQGQAPVRRVCEADAWQRTGGTQRSVHALRRQDRVLGYLAVDGTVAPAAPGGGPSFVLGAGDLADRLSLVLANVEHARDLHRAARYDALTGLANRRTASEALALAVAAAQSGGTDGALLYIDLDRFKRVNDSAGHRAGDELLQHVAARLQAALQPGELAARLAGDEFLLVVPACGDEPALLRRAHGLIGRLGEPVRVAERLLQVEASIGVARFPRDGTRVEELLQRADIAMYRAKEAGRARALAFQPGMQRQLEARLDLEAGLRGAFERGEFRLAYQPIVSLAPGEPCGLEALLRWPAGNRGTAWTPAQFVPVAEDMGLIVPLGEWVLRAACTQFMAWQRAGVPCGYVSVNASTLQLRQPGFAALVQSVLAEAGMPPSGLLLEVTESVFADGAAVEATLRSLAAAGVRLALDDFGTGYSSLSYLGKYPFDKVKIDRSFVLGLPGDASSCRLVESIVALCAALGKQVVAEGVETDAQRGFLADAGCHALQGYLYSRPVDAEAIPALLKGCAAA